MDGRWYLLEINPRLSGWLCLAEADGAGMLAAYWRMMGEGVALSPAWLQRDVSCYVRTIGHRYHEPDWWLETLAGDHAIKKAKRLGRCLRQFAKVRPNVLLGGWDGRDAKASILLAWDALRALCRERRSTP